MTSELWPMISNPPTDRLRVGFPALMTLTALLLLCALLIFGACASRAAPAADPLSVYLPALKESGAGQLEQLTSAPTYAISVTVDAENKTLTGVGSVVVHNTSPDPWSHLLFRLYPNLEHYGGDMAVQSVTLNGKPTAFTYQDDATSLRISLPKPLLPGESATVRMNWKLGYPSWVDDRAVYALFGRSQQMTSLPLFYPSLAVYQAGPAVGSGKWWVEQGVARGDSAFNVASLFHVTATLPSAQTPVASGTLVHSQTVGADQVQYTWVTGPAREFLLHMSPVFSSASEEAFGTRVTSYWLPGEEAAGRSALRYAVAALRAFSDLYGDYPFRDVRVAPAPLSFRGMEYPQVILLGVDLYDAMRSNLEVLVAHEMAHQWWYQMVHSDPVNSPWLDEGLAEYSVKLYKEELSGQDDADLLQYQRWQVPYESLQQRGADAQVNQTVESFASGTQYETIVYGKGALFYDRLREELGDRQFKRFLRTYLNAHRWQIITDDDFLSALHVLAKPELVKLYKEWIGERKLTQAAQTAPESGN